MAKREKSLLLLCFAGILSFVTLLLQLITLACASLALVGISQAKREQRLLRWYSY
jgi:hypothetical protein